MKTINNSYCIIYLLQLIMPQVNGIVFNLQAIPSNSTTSIRNLESNYTFLYGNSSGLNYYYVNIYLGNPPAKQSLIIDTGSSITTVPCKQLCVNCGKHLNSYYKLKSNSQIIQCKSDQCSSVSSTCSSGNCTFSSSYSEGSSLSGVYIEEEVSFGSNSDHFPKKKLLPIGCTASESDIFFTQLADGIMGLSNNDKAFSSVLHKNGLINRNVFSICLADNGGFFSLGDIDTSYHVNAIEYISTRSAGHLFQVDLTQIRVGNKSFDIGDDFDTIIDSGTTITYFPQPIYDFILNEFDAVCLNMTLCLDKKRVRDLGQCYFIPTDLLFELVDYLPSITFTFKHKVEYILDLKDSYFIESKINDKVTICLGYSTWGKNEILLGGTWMRNHDIVFDRENIRVGFTRSNCTRRLTSTIDDDPNALKTKNCAENYQNIFSIVYVILLCVIVFLSTAIYYIRKGKKFFCFKKRFNSSIPQTHQVIDDEIEKAIGVRA